MNIKYAQKLLVALLLCCCTPLWAEDIDLFVGSPADSNDLPNVLLIIDNTANWEGAFSNEMSALATTFENLPVNADGSARFNVGLLMFSETSSSDSTPGGAYVRAALRPMNTITKNLYKQMILSFHKNADKSNGGAAGLAMAEAFRYFSGGTPYSGNNKAKTDYAGNTAADWAGPATTAQNKPAMQVIYPLPGNALFSKGGVVYNWPVGSQCGRNYIIYVSNGSAQDNTSETNQSRSMLSSAGGSTTTIAVSPTNSNISDEWARFLKNDSPLAVTTYTVDVDPRTTGQGPTWTRVLKSMAEVSGGIQNYTAVQSGNGGAEIDDALGDAFSEIQAINSVFASVTLPVSANTQSTYSNNVYIGMFRPDQSANPRWNGNLKQYRLGYLNGALRLLDSDGDSAINTATGFITECARSFWTSEVTDDYWAFRPAGECIVPTGTTNPNLYRNSNSPDGNIVEKGGQGYALRGGSPTARTLKTCSLSSCTSLSEFSTSNLGITAALLNTTAAERDNLINWARGQDLANEDGDSGASSTTEMRPSSHGDVVHSRAVAVDVGTAGTPQVVVFYGGNDGFFRAVNGNQTGDIGSAIPGKEMWAFMPPEFYGNLKRLRENTQKISFVGTTATDVAPKIYGIDGPITAYRGTNSTWVYATMRRGGRAMYAFNVPHNDPADITLKWRVGCPNNFAADGSVSDTGCTSGFSGVGQTWSSAKPLSAQGYAAGPLLVVSGGYDVCEDNDSQTCTSSAKGNKIYVLDANSGTLLKTLDTERSVVADVTIVPDSSGLAKYGYVADLGGNVYRINIGANAPSNWTITKIADLGCATTTDCTDGRKFMFSPDIVEATGEYIVLLGSGDREKPLLHYDAAVGVSNYFFMLRDRPADTTWLSSEASNCTQAVLCLNSLLPILTDANPAQSDLDAKKGWYLGMRSTEQVVTSAITIFGAVTFSTHTPDVPVVGACSSRLGIARVYNISYLNATSANGTQDRSEELPPDTGLPPSPVAGMVDLGGEPVPFCIGCDPTSSIEASEPAVPASVMPTQPKARVYWYIRR